jgi:ferredoxin-NADP reductase
MVADYVGEVVENKKLNETVFETALKSDKPMEWEAGQYVSIQTPAPRSYSICSLPNQEVLSICVDTKPGGPGSILIKNAKVGDKISFKGPLGKFQITKIQDANYIFVATGTGIAPFKAMIPTLLNNQETRYKIQLYWGLRHRSEAYYQDFFDSLKSDKFDYQMVFSEEGHHVTEFVQLEQNTDYYLCGNMNMIADIKKKLDSSGVIEDKIHFESFF